MATYQIVLHCSKFSASSLCQLVCRCWPTCQ